MPSDDRLLIQRVAQGDQRALELLYQRYRLSVWRYLWYRLDGRAGQVEELLQEVFLAVWKSASRYRGEAQVSTWILRIAHHLLLNARRRDARSPQETHSIATDGLISYAERHEGEVCPAEAMQHPQHAYEEEVLDRLLLANSLQKLSQKHREVLELVFYYGFSCQEVAQILAVSVGTVKSRMNAARHKLFEELTQAHTPKGGHS